MILINLLMYTLCWHILLMYLVATGDCFQLGTTSSLGPQLTVSVLPPLLMPATWPAAAAAQLWIPIIKKWMAVDLVAQSVVAAWATVEIFPFCCLQLWQLNPRCPGYPDLQTLHLQGFLKYTATRNGTHRSQRGVNVQLGIIYASWEEINSSSG